MKQYVSDTQCLIWYLAKHRRLPRRVRAVFEAGKQGNAQALVPSICLIETLYLLQRQRVKANVVRAVMAHPETHDAAIFVVPLDMKVANAVADFGPAVVTDLPDRVIAATARAYGLPLLSTDHAIAESGMVEVIN